jgi:alpha-glucuronidase
MFGTLFAENGYKMWLRAATGAAAQVTVNQTSVTIATAKEELQSQWRGSPVSLNIVQTPDVVALTADGYTITGNPAKDAAGVTINASAEQGLLYGAYHLLRLQETNTLPATLNISEKPSYRHRILFDWNSAQNFSGGSIWKWSELPAVVSSRYRDFARINASVGINGICVQTITSDRFNTTFYSQLKAIADAMRPYHLRVYVIIPFDVPKSTGSLSTYDPLNQSVRDWWKARMDDLYTYIPDMGGIIMKADSEGMKGPKDYNRTHAQGANMLAEALGSRGIVLWRAFVYDATDADRIKEAYQEFKPLDGQFSDNVQLMVKNGPFDFQPREPFTPLFGAVQQTPVAPELEITQEYMGGSDDLVYLGSMWEEFFKSDTYAKGEGSTVAKATDGTLFGHQQSAVVAIANHGNDANWCGHHFAQANWYAFGRLAWNNRQTAENIAREWLAQTFSTDDRFVEPALDIMMRSHEAIVDYQMPLGLNGLFQFRTHTAPGPDDVVASRPDWRAPYYHKADYNGLGFDRTSSGSNAVGQYFQPLRGQLDNANTCDERYILWFHHLPWNHTMKSGLSLWDELCRHYYRGVQEVIDFQKSWNSLQPYVDPERFNHVRQRLQKQLYNAVHWKTVCLNYFQTFSQQPVSVEIPFTGQDATVSNCYSTGQVTVTGDSLGGIIGATRENVMINNSYYLRNVISGSNTFGTGKPLSEMQATAFVDLLNSGNSDVTDRWLVGSTDNDMFPVLRIMAVTNIAPSPAAAAPFDVGYAIGDNTLRIANSRFPNTVIVRDPLGRVSLIKRDVGNTLTLQALPDGIYILTVLSGNEQRQLKIIKHQQ